VSARTYRSRRNSSPAAEAVGNTGSLGRALVSSHRNAGVQAAPRHPEADDGEHDRRRTRHSSLYGHLAHAAHRLEVRPGVPQGLRRNFIRRRDLEHELEDAGDIEPSAIDAGCTVAGVRQAARVGSRGHREMHESAYAVVSWRVRRVTAGGTVAGS
jgi:hypothetical protein